MLKQPLTNVCAVQLCCVTRQWLVTKEMIQLQHGCCGSMEDTMYVKRIKDISFVSNCCCSVRISSFLVTSLPVLQPVDCPPQMHV